MKRNKRIGMDVGAMASKVREHYSLPADARFKGVEFNEKNGRMIFEFEHQTFNLVKTVPLINTDETVHKVPAKTKKSKKK